MDNRYIGVFDSGVGGLTFVKELMKNLPDENIVYFGDTGRVPYGTRSADTIKKYAIDDMNFLMTHDIKAVVIACGTVSTVAIPTLRKIYNIPIIGVVDASAIAAVNATENNKIGIIGTIGTIKSGKYEQAIKEISPMMETASVACPMFVPLVENNMADTEASYLIAKDYLKPFVDMGVDTLILGCTHYPLLSNTIRKIMGDHVKLIDAGAATAHFVSEYLKNKNMLSETREKEQYKFFVSDSVENFINVADKFLGRKIDDSVQKIDIEIF
ncbi:MAG: glutamate racemase [Ruminococcaceae bacterium]|nr:glutamate racemase [Oscillospiraceae bacterium]